MPRNLVEEVQALKQRLGATADIQPVWLGGPSIELFVDGEPLGLRLRSLSDDERTELVAFAAQATDPLIADLAATVTSIVDEAHQALANRLGVSKEEAGEIALPTVVADHEDPSRFTEILRDGRVVVMPDPDDPSKAAE